MSTFCKGGEGRAFSWNASLPMQVLLTLPICKGRLQTLTALISCGLNRTSGALWNWEDLGLGTLVVGLRRGATLALGLNLNTRKQDSYLHLRLQLD